MSDLHKIFIFELAESGSFKRTQVLLRVKLPFYCKVNKITLCTFNLALSSDTSILFSVLLAQNFLKNILKLSMKSHGSDWNIARNALQNRAKPN